MGVDSCLSVLQRAAGRPAGVLWNIGLAQTDFSFEAYMEAQHQLAHRQSSRDGSVGHSTPSHFTPSIECSKSLKNIEFMGGVKRVATSASVRPDPFIKDVQNVGQDWN